MLIYNIKKIVSSRLFIVFYSLLVLLFFSFFIIGEQMIDQNNLYYTASSSMQFWMFSFYARDLGMVLFLVCPLLISNFGIVQSSIEDRSKYNYNYFFRYGRIRFEINNVIAIILVTFFTTILAFLPIVIYSLIKYNLYTDYIVGQYMFFFLNYLSEYDLAIFFLNNSYLYLFLYITIISTLFAILNSTIYMLVLLLNKRKLIDRFIIAFMYHSLFILLTFRSFPIFSINSFVASTMEPKKILISLILYITYLLIPQVIFVVLSFRKERYES